MSNIFYYAKRILDKILGYTLIHRYLSSGVFFSSSAKHRVNRDQHDQLVDLLFPEVKLSLKV